MTLLLCFYLETGTPEVTTPLSATWATAPAEITGNLMAELEKDPQFMQASSTATAFPATVKGLEIINTELVGPFAQ